eukprot:TRINITY_DN15437_c0_g1_i3.p1 TRINITY_DN15437_c0_g1~~TRINITY_DN15437_c0_g1_i3.p1  ORF type:complete len:652 (+),score=55.92 TRINITY_DN15437_c0_g1_i3:133-2088(+)
MEHQEYDVYLAQHREYAWKGKQKGKGGRQGFQAFAAERKSGDGREKMKRTQVYKAINREITYAADGGSVWDVLEVANKHMYGMNGMNLATAFHRVAKLSTLADADAGLISHPIFERLRAILTNNIVNHSLRLSPESEAAHSSRPAHDGLEMPVQCMSIVSWACATLRLKDAMLLESMLDIAVPRLHMMKPFEVSNFVWAYAKLTAPAPDLFRVVGDRFLARSPGDFKPQCLATLAWAYASSGIQDAFIFSGVAEELAANVHSMKTQEMSNTLWAFAKSSFVDVTFFDTIGTAAVSKKLVGKFKAQELSNSVWAFAKANIVHWPFFREVEYAATERRFDMVPQNFANIMWSYAKLQVKPVSQMAPMFLQICVSQLGQHKRRELCTLVWSASVLCPEASFYFNAIAKFCVGRRRGFSAFALSNLVKNLSVTRLDDTAHFLEIVRYCCEVLEDSDDLVAVRAAHDGVQCALENPYFQADAPSLVCLQERLAALVENVGQARGNAYRQNAADGMNQRSAIYARDTSFNDDEEDTYSVVDDAQYTSIDNMTSFGASGSGSRGISSSNHGLYFADDVAHGWATTRRIDGCDPADASGSYVRTNLVDAPHGLSRPTGASPEYSSTWWDNTQARSSENLADAVPWTRLAGTPCGRGCEP